MSAKRIKVDGDIAISEEALEKIRKDAVEKKKWINDVENDVSVQSIFDKGNLNLLKIWVEK